MNTKFQDELKFQVLKELEVNPELTQRSLSKKFNVSLGSINFCIKALLDVGFIKLNNFAKSDNKIAYSYVLTPDGISAKAKITSEFLKRKMKEFELLEKEILELKKEMGLIKHE